MRIMLIGPPRSGKSTYFRYFQRDREKIAYTPTVGTDYSGFVKPQLLDTAGEEALAKLVLTNNEVCKDVAGYLCFFDMQDPDSSLAELATLIQSIPEGRPFILVGTHVAQATETPADVTEKIRSRYKWSAPFYLTLTPTGSSDDDIAQPITTLLAERPFATRKKEIEDNFMGALDQLYAALKPYPEASNVRIKGMAFYQKLLDETNKTFEALKPDATQVDIDSALSVFRGFSKQEIDRIDSVMGPRWYVRLIEVTAKAIGALIGFPVMTAGMLLGQGFLNPDDVASYRDTFFTLHRTKPQKALDEIRENMPPATLAL